MMKMTWTEWADYLRRCEDGGVPPDVRFKPDETTLEPLPGFDEEARWWTADMIAGHLQTSRRTVLRWVAEGRLPPPRKFGKLARWPRELVERIREHGVPSLPTETSNAVRGLPPGGLNCTCPHCEATLKVFVGAAGYEVEVTLPPPPKPAKKPAARPAAEKPAKKGKK